MMYDSLLRVLYIKKGGKNEKGDHGAKSYSEGCQVLFVSVKGVLYVKMFGNLCFSEFGYIIKGEKVM